MQLLYGSFKQHSAFYSVLSSSSITHLLTIKLPNCTLSTSLSNGELMGEINWFVTLLISLLLSIPVGLVINLLTPPLQDWVDRRTISSRGKRLDRLKSEYQNIKELHDQPELLNLTVTRLIMQGLSFLMFAIITFIAFPRLVSWGLGDSLFGETLVGFIYLLTTIMLALLINRLDSLARSLTRLIKFSEYEKEVLTKINALEGRALELKSKKKI